MKRIKERERKSERGREEKKEKRGIIKREEGIRQG